MPPSLRPADTDRSEPKIAAPGPRSLAAPLPLRRTAPAAGREPASDAWHAPAERLAPGLTAGERVLVASVMTGGDRERRRRPGLLLLFVLLVLIAFASVGAATVYHSIAGAFPS